MSLVRTPWSFVVTFVGLICINQVSGQSDSQNLNREIEKNTGCSKAAAHARVTKSDDSSKQPVVDGTWFEEGRYIILNINGQKLRLLKSQPDAKGIIKSEQNEQDSVVKQVAGQPEVTGAIVDGRMLVGRNPLIKCHVTLIPLRKSWDSYVTDKTAEKYSATTDSTGEYQFHNVKRGRYKLFWRPQDTQQWIRRLRFKPDVIVRDRKHVQVKTIRSALRTIN